MNNTPQKLRKISVSKTFTKQNVVIKFAYSCGYEVVKATYLNSGWTQCEVIDRDTKEPRGTRWISVKLNQPPKIRKEPPENA